jgi:hypothetical protein
MAYWRWIKKVSFTVLSVERYLLWGMGDVVDLWAQITFA